MKETIIRSLTGIAIIALIVLIMLIHPLVYLLVFCLACILSWLEFARMYRENIPASTKIIAAVFLSGSFILSFFTASGELADKWLLLPATLLIPLFILMKLLNPRGSIERNLLIGIVIIYLLAGYSLLHFMAFSKGHEGYSPRWILFTFYFLWMFDTMAYVSGRLAGKHRIWPSVSPGKTWEGSIGGTVFTIALALAFSHFFQEFSAGEWVGFAGIVIVFGSLGDFFESWLKRIAGVKDSGKILPGHGGILDRLDSLLLSVPFVTLYLYIIL